MTKQGIIDYVTNELESYTTPSSITPSILANIIASACTMVYRPADIYCSNSGIESLDLSEYDNLERLYGNGNPFTDLNIAACTALKFLSIRGSQISTLNLATNILLESVDVSNNNYLNTLTLPPNANIKDLNISNTGNLPTVSISHLTQLRKFEAEGKDYSAMDLSTTSALPATLKHLNLTNTDITNLNLTDKTILEYLDVKNNTDLDTLNLTGVTNLKYLNIEGTSITDLDVSDNTLLTTLKANEVLTTLNLNNTGIENLQIYCPLLTSLVTTNMPSLKLVNLPSVVLTTTSFPNSPLLESISINGTITSFDASIYPNLKTLQLGNTNLSTFTLPSSSTSLQTLKVHKYPGGTLDLTAYPNMRDFNLRENSDSNLIIDASGMTNFTHFNLSQVTIDTLDLTGSNINEADFNLYGTIQNVIMDDIPFTNFNIFNFSYAYKNFRARNMNLTNDVSFMAGSYETLDLNNLQFTGAPNKSMSIQSLYSLTSITATNSGLIQLSLQSNPLLTNLNLSGSANLSTVINFNSIEALSTVNLSGCALNATEANKVLSYLANNSTVNNGNLDLSGGTNAALDATGLTHKATLEGRGWTVTHN